MDNAYLVAVVATFVFIYISVMLTFMLGELMKSNRLKKVELKHLGVPEKEIKGK